MFSVIIAGLTIGIMGSFHCVGMCGPLALALPVYGKSSGEKFFSILLYHIGRALSYGFMGAFFGLIGSQFFISGYQQWLSIAAGLSILIILLVKPFQFSFLQNAVQQTLSRLFQSKKAIFSYLLIGIVNGFLPCGLVYLALASAAATGSWLEGSLLMLMFGFGTIPLMFSLSYLGQYISISIRQKMQKLVPIFVGITAFLLVLRGLNLGIPYVSPHFESGKTMKVKCH